MPRYGRTQLRKVKDDLLYEILESSDDEADTKEVKICPTIEKEVVHESGAPSSAAIDIPTPIKK